MVEITIEEAYEMRLFAERSTNPKNYIYAAELFIKLDMKTAENRCIERAIWYLFDNSPRSLPLDR
ncbi:hypothetical protein ACFLXB_03595 [Chloroflexota bacterium]